jgi:hypothetical protein
MESNNIKEVKQYTKDGVLLGTFKSLKEAAKQTGCNYYSISKVCNFKKDYVNGFRFEFEDIT